MSFPIPKPDFMVFAWNVPAKDFAKWKARGVNTLMGCGLEAADTTVARQDWAKAAADQGLWVIYNPMGGPVPDNLLYFLHDDEPDGKGPDSKGLPAADLIARRDAFRRVNAAVPVWMSCMGNKLTDPGRDAYYTSIEPAADGFSEDWYVHSRDAMRYPMRFKGQALQTLRRCVAPGKRIASIIETCWQHLENTPFGRSPTPDEVRTMIRHCLSFGADIGFFSHFFRPVAGSTKVAWAGFDGTDAATSDVITEEIALAKQTRAAFPIIVKPAPPAPSDPPPPVTIMGVFARLSDGRTVPLNG